MARLALGVGLITALGAGLALGQAQAQSPTQAQSQPTPSQPGRIVGQDTMSDRNRSGPDGWSWAPMDRRQAPSGQSPTEANGNSGRGISAAPAPNVGKPTPPGQDPGTPMSASPSGPGTQDVPSNGRH